MIMSEVLVATQDAAVTIDGIPHVIEKGRTLAHSGHPIVTGNPALWQPLDVTYDVDEPAPKAPARTTPPPAAPAAKKQGAGQ
jgi:hypothetical protein